MDNPKSYIKNTRTSRSRNIRIEVTGEVTEEERHFLNGVSLFVAGTLSKDNHEYTTFVAGRLTRLIKAMVVRIKKMRGEK